MVNGAVALEGKLLPCVCVCVCVAAANMGTEYGMNVVL
jgi:hypothetical protein